jgi:hypothetical protein
MLPARFDHQTENWLSNAWSLAIEVTGIQDAHGDLTGTARFLAPEAPHDWLSVGKKFTLFAGERAIAAGEILEVIPA